MFNTTCNWFASWVTKVVIQTGPLTSTSMSNIKPEVRANAFGSPTASLFCGAIGHPIEWGDDI